MSKVRYPLKGIKPFHIQVEKGWWISTRDCEWSGFGGPSWVPNVGFVLACQSTSGWMYDSPPTDGWGVILSKTFLSFGQVSSVQKMVRVSTPWHQLGYKNPTKLFLEDED